MQVDISRDSFDKDKGMLRILQQQGCAYFDADGNEQTAILLHRLHTLAADVFGPHWGPRTNPGFLIEDQDKKSFTIGEGRYYVNGLMIENPKTVSYANQPFFLPDPPESVFDKQKTYVVYVEVWERLVTDIHSEPVFRDNAFEQLGPTPRTQIVWQVRFGEIKDPKPLHDANSVEAKQKVLLDWLQTQFEKPAEKPTLMARSHPKTHYTGDENQLYRVEILRSGIVAPPSSDNSRETSASGPTFKWSRDNGSPIFALAKWEPETSSPKNEHYVQATLETPFRDSRFRLQAEDWVEYVDDNTALWTKYHDSPPYAAKLMKVVHVDDFDLTKVRLSVCKEDTDGPSKIQFKSELRPFLRRWDQRTPEGSRSKESDLIDPSPADDNAWQVLSVNSKWMPLENGVQVSFAPGHYSRGDYWLIPARIANENVSWPLDIDENPESLPPRSIIHYYAPLAIIEKNKPIDARLCPKTDLVEPIPTEKPPKPPRQ